MPTTRKHCPTGEYCKGCVHSIEGMIFQYCAAPWLPPPPPGKMYMVKRRDGHICEHFELPEPPIRWWQWRRRRAAAIKAALARG